MSIEHERRARAEEYPAFLLVEEAADALRISRGKAYAMARRYRETGGVEGLPVKDLGHALRVPVEEFEAWFGPLPDWFLAKRAAATLEKDRERSEKARSRAARKRPAAGASSDAREASLQPGPETGLGDAQRRPKVAAPGGKRRRHPSGQLSLLDGWSGQDEPSEP